MDNVCSTVQGLDSVYPTVQWLDSVYPTVQWVDSTSTKSFFQKVLDFLLHIDISTLNLHLLYSQTPGLIAAT